MPSFESPNTPAQQTAPGNIPNAPRFRRTPACRAWLVLFFTANTAALVLLALGRPCWAVAVFFLPAPWYAWQVSKPSAHALCPIVRSFTTSRREVWLTLDDGPDPSSTPALLALLARHDAKATFFLIGKKARAHPELVSEILRQGHSLGNHSFSHAPYVFWFASARRIAAEIDDGTAALQQAGPIRLFRSPVGLKNHALFPALARRQMALILWSARGFDSSSEPATALARITPDIRPGAIILAHETPADPARQNALLSGLFTFLEANGYKCVLPSPASFVRET